MKKLIYIFSIFCIGIIFTACSSTSSTESNKPQYADFGPGFYKQFHGKFRHLSKTEHSVTKD